MIRMTGTQVLVPGAVHSYVVTIIRESVIIKFFLTRVQVRRCQDVVNDKWRFEMHSERSFQHDILAEGGSDEARF